MSVKLDNKFIKQKVKAKYGEFEVYNPLEKDVYNQLSELIINNSKTVNLEDNKTDIEIDNTINIMRFMLINLTNIEDQEYWNNINDLDLEKMLNNSDKEFKNVISDLIDIMLEIAQDNRKNAIRKLDMFSDKLKELTKITNFNNDIEKSLNKLGLNKELLEKIQNGDKEAIKKFEKSLFEKQTSKNKHTKKIK